MLPHFYNNIGELYKLQKQYEPSMKNHQSALEIYKDINDSIGIAGALLNISKVHFILKNYEQARSILNESKLIYEKVQNYEGLFNTFHSLGNIEESNGKYQKAIEYYKQSENYLDKIGDEFLGPIFLFHITLNNSLGKCYLKLGEHEIAERILLEVFQLASKNGQLEALKDVSNNLSKLYNNTGQEKKALEYFQSFKLFSDSISKDENIKKLTQLQMQFEFDKMMKQIELEQLRYKASQRKKEFMYLAIIGGSLVMLIVLSLLLNMQRLKRKSGL